MRDRAFAWEIPMEPSHPHYSPAREAIRRALLDKGLNPKSAAERAGFQRHWLYNFLTGAKHSVDGEDIAKVLKLLGLPLDLLTKTDDSGPHNPPGMTPEPEVNIVNNSIELHYDEILDARQGNECGLTLEPLLIEILKKIPSKGKPWPGPQRKRWFQVFAMVVSQVYDDNSTPVDLRITLENAEN